MSSDTILRFPILPSALLASSSLVRLLSAWNQAGVRWHLRIKGFSKASYTFGIFSHGLLCAVTFEKGSVQVYKEPMSLLLYYLVLSQEISFDQNSFHNLSAKILCKRQTLQTFPFFFTGPYCHPQAILLGEKDDQANNSTSRETEPRDSVELNEKEIRVYVLPDSGSLSGDASSFFSWSASSNVRSLCIWEGCDRREVTIERRENSFISNSPARIRSVREGKTANILVVKGLRG